MMRKSQNTIKKILQSLLILATIITMVALGIFLWSLVSDTPKEEEPPIVDPSVKQTFNFEVKDFTLFKIEEFEFNFLLANIQIDSNKPINLSLSHFTTSEGIQLNSVDNYLNAIESAGYNFGDYNPVFSLSSSENILNAVLFIPIKDKKLDTLELNVNIYPSYTMNLDLTNPTKTGTKEDLGLNLSNIDPSMVASISVLRKTMISPSEFYQLDSNGNRVEANFTSQSQIIGIKIDVTSKISESFRITNAQIKNGGMVYDAVNKSFLIDGVTNLNNEYINESATGFLFFEVLGDVSLSSFTEVHIFFSTNEDQFFTLPIEGN